MAMRFPYLPLATTKPIPSLGGAMVRHRPVLAIWVTGPSGTLPFSGCIDSGCDDTIFPEAFAAALGIDLSAAARGESRTIDGNAVPFLYERVVLRITDGNEECQWGTTVGFADIPMRWGLLGHAGFLDFFDIELRGAQREVVIKPNASFTGSHTIFRSISS